MMGRASVSNSTGNQYQDRITHRTNLEKSFFRVIEADNLGYW